MMPGFAALQAALPGAQGTPRAEAQRLAGGAPGDFAALIGAAGEAPLPAPLVEPVVAAQGQSTLSEHELPPSDLPPSLAWLPAPIEALAVPAGLRPDGLTAEIATEAAAAGIAGRVSGESRASRQAGGALAVPGGLRSDGLTQPAEMVQAEIVRRVGGESGVSRQTEGAPDALAGLRPDGLAHAIEAVDAAAQLLASAESRVPSPGITGLAAAATELRAPPPPLVLDAAAPEFAGDLAEQIVWQL
ncbi:MAG: hypothetical protein ACLGI7_04935, partial [Gammaproteobacteria bacterium]